MKPDIYKSKQTQEILQYVRDEYNNEPEFLWQKFSTTSILRNHENNKWYAAFMTITKNKLGLKPDEPVEVIDLRFNKHEALDFVASNQHIYPGYHMNKQNWITIILDGSLETEQILELLDNSYQISLRKN